MTDKHVNAVRERPILFSKPMVLALLAGTKTQTRRAVKAPAWFEGHLIHAKNEHGGYDVLSDHGGGEQMLCPYGAPGDQLWVKETHRFWDHDFETVDVEMRADTSAKYVHFDRGQKPSWLYSRKADGMKPWRPSIFMPRWASRITLEIESVRVERLQDISEEDAKAEGIGRETKRGVEWFDIYPKPDDYPGATNDPRLSYRTLWESINGTGSWALNPWVWAITFRRLNPDPAKQ